MIKLSERNFWLAQVIGWGIFALSNFIVQYMGLVQGGSFEISVTGVLINSLVAFIGGMTVTSAYRYFVKSRKLNLLKFGRTLIYILVSTLLLTTVFMFFVGLIVYVADDRRMMNNLEIFSNFFMFGILMLIWNSLYFMLHYLHSWKNAESERWRLEASVKEAQLGNLKSQINPHFMFNAINNIRALITEDAEKAKDMLLHFSDMFRYALVHSDPKLVPVEEEVMIVRKYLELLSIQFEEKLTYHVEVDEGILKETIPPMMLQLLVENAVKHGISENRLGGVIRIEGKLTNKQVCWEVRNTGSLEVSSKLQNKLGVGLSNIRERLALLYGKNATLTLGEDGLDVVAKVIYPQMELV